MNIMQARADERKRPLNNEFRTMNTPASNESTEQSSKCPFLVYVENNPMAAVLQALAAGFAVGLLVRVIEGSRSKDPGIDVKHKPSVDEAKYHLGSLVLPFLWPAWQKAQEGYGKSAEAVREAVREAVEKVKNTDLASEGRKHLKKAEQWAEREAEHLAGLGKTNAKQVEKWVEEEILPAAECGWKKLQKFFR